MEKQSFGKLSSNTAVWNLYRGFIYKENVEVCCSNSQDLKALAEKDICGIKK